VVHLWVEFACSQILNTCILGCLLLSGAGYPLSLKNVERKDMLHKDTGIRSKSGKGTRHREWAQMKRERYGNAQGSKIVWLRKKTADFAR